MSASHYEWRLVHDGVGRVPNIRSDTTGFFYNNTIWVICGSGAGLGKSNEVWKFDLTVKLWQKVDTTGQEVPVGRDGHSGTYIGNGRFVIFGGQGFPEPNKKLGKESESLKAQTYCKRDVYNDIWVFDCNTLHWSPIYPDGLDFPMGRRGHSAIYIPPTNPFLSSSHDHTNGGGRKDDESTNISSSSYSMSVTSSVAPSASNMSQPQHHDHPHDHPNQSATHSHNRREASPPVTTLPGNSLVIFGGAGIELSKYTEQVYNDLWVYSFDTNMWCKHETRGIEPHATCQHRVAVAGDNMMIIGGILGTSATSAISSVASTVGSMGRSSTPSSAEGILQNDCDVQVLNLRTSTWSFLKVYDNLGRNTRINSLGFSLLTDIPSARAPPVAPSESDPSIGGKVKQLVMFGGKESVDGKVASTVKQFQSRREPREGNITILDLERGAMVSTSVHAPQSFRVPDLRYGHLAVPGVPPREPIVPPAPTEAADSTNDANKRGRAGRRQVQPNPDLASGELVVMYLFGGCRLETNGYCDPVLYSLVKVFAGGSTMSSARTDYTTGRTTDRTSVNDDAMSTQRGSELDSPSAASLMSHRPSMLSPIGAGGSTGRSSFMNGTNRSMRSPSMMMSLASVPEDEFAADLSQPSIWYTLQRKEQLNTRLSDTIIKPPNNWEEMKLSLTSSRSIRILHGKEITPNGLKSRDHTNTHHHSSSTDLLQSQSQHMSRSRHTLSSPSLSQSEFKYRTVASYNRGSPNSPWNLPAAGGLDEKNPAQALQTLSLLQESAWGSRMLRGLDSRGARRPPPMEEDKPATPNERLLAEMTGHAVKHAALEKEERQQRIKLIKKTLQPVIRAQTKIAAREKYHAFFPLKTDT